MDTPTPESDPKRCYNYALYLLARQDYSEHKIRQKMKQKGYIPEVIDTTVKTLVEKKYIREEEYKRLLALKWIRKGRADRFIQQIVSKENLEVSQEELDTWRNESSQSEEDSVGALIEKKLRGQTIPADRLARQKLKEKLIRFLCSRGFSYEDIKSPVDQRLKQ